MKLKQSSVYVNPSIPKKTKFPAGKLLAMLFPKTKMSILGIKTRSNLRTRYYVWCTKLIMSDLELPAELYLQCSALRWNPLLAVLKASTRPDYLHTYMQACIFGSFRLSSVCAAVSKVSAGRPILLSLSVSRSDQCKSCCVLWWSRDVIAVWTAVLSIFLVAGSSDLMSCFNTELAGRVVVTCKYHKLISKWCHGLMAVAMVTNLCDPLGYRPQ